MPAVIGFILAVIGFQQLAELPSQHTAWWLLAVLLVLGAIRWFGRAVQPLVTVVSVLLGLILGTAWVWYHAEQRLADGLDVAQISQDVVVEGQIITAPKRQGRAQRFEFLLQQPPSGIPKHLILSIYHPLPLQLGQRWRWTVRLTPAEGAANPAGFDYERWLFAKGIAARGYVRRKPAAVPLPTPWWSLDGFRARVSVAIEQQCAECSDDSIALLKALAVADRSYISSEQWQLLRDTGTAHLVAISGLHIGLLAGLSWLLSGWLAIALSKLQLIGLPSWLSLGLRGRWGAMLLAALAYSALAGFALPTLRALLMLLVLLLFKLNRQAVSPWQVLIIVLALIVFIWPFAPLEPGFWLSFGAVGWIIWLLSGRRQRLQSWRAALWVQMGLSLALMPVLLLWFGAAPLLSPVANLVAVPLFSVLIVPVLLFCLLLLPLVTFDLSVVQWPLALLAQVLEWHGAWLQWLGQLPVLAWQPPTMPALSLLSAALGMVLLTAPRGLPVRPLGLLLLLPVLVFSPERPVSGEFVLTTLDVGQGSAHVVETANHVLLYDTGPGYQSGGSASQTVILPYLRGQGWQGLDALVLSHGDWDHRGGVPAVLKALPIQRRLSSQPKWLKNAQLCQAGQEWRWDGVQFAIVHPDAGKKDWSDNNGSCVLRIQSDSASALLTGDIEHAAERSRQWPTADVLVAPHHGSKSSSSLAFLQQVQPQQVVISAGRRNRWRMPHTEVLQRYQQLNIPWISTANAGAIIYQSQQNHLFGWRQSHRRYWMAATMRAFSDPNY